MSRIGRMPITLPAGVDVTIDAGNVVTVKGPKGTITQQLSNKMTLSQEGNVISVTRPNDEKENRSLHGLTRTLLSNMVTGVTEGYKKELDVNGVGYKVAKEGKKLIMNIGFSHQVIVEEEDGISIDAPTPQPRLSSPALISRRWDSSLLKSEKSVRPSRIRVRELSIQTRSFAVRKARPAQRSKKEVCLND